MTQTSHDDFHFIFQGVYKIPDAIKDPVPRSCETLSAKLYAQEQIMRLRGMAQPDWLKGGQRPLNQPIRWAKTDQPTPGH